MAELDGFQPVCKASLVKNGDLGHVFNVYWEHAYTQAFVIRYKDIAHGFLNRCAHQAVELDWNKGEFFDADKQFLICATHGALYSPENGNCASGRCQGRGLTRLDIQESGKVIYVKSDYPLK